MFVEKAFDLAISKRKLLLFIAYKSTSVGYSHFNEQHCVTKVLFYENYNFKSKSLRASGLMYCESLRL